MSSFDLEKYMDFIRGEVAHIDTRNKPATEIESTLYWVVKNGEESGELMNEILIRLKLCRKEKIRDNQAELTDEFADAVNTLFALAYKLGIEPGEALMKRAAAIQQRNIDFGNI